MADRIDLVRHPDKDGDAEGIYLGWNATISNRGAEEAEYVVRRLGQFPHELIVSSQIPRAITLAKMYGERLNVPVMTDPLFNEIAKPQFLVGLHREDPIHIEVTRIIRDAFDDDGEALLPADLQKRIWDQLGLAVDAKLKIENRTDLERRVENIFRRFDVLRREDSVQVHSALIVSHAKLIAAIIQYGMCGTLRGFYSQGDRVLKINTTGITTFVREPDRRPPYDSIWKIANVNDTAHIDRSMEDKLHGLAHQLAARDHR